MIPRPLRRAVVLLALLGLAGLVVLAFRYGGRGTPGALDRRVDARLDGLDGRSLLGHLVSFGDPLVVMVLAVVLAGICLALGRRRLAVVAVVGPGLTGLATTALKPLVGRTISGDNLALPSGHTGGATAVAAVVALLVIGVAGNRLRTAVVALAGVLAAGALMGVALVADDVHYATDTVAGFCTALAVVACVALAVDLVAERAVRSG